VEIGGQERRSGPLVEQRAAPNPKMESDSKMGLVQEISKLFEENLAILYELVDDDDWRGDIADQEWDRLAKPINRALQNFDLGYLGFCPRNQRWDVPTYLKHFKRIAELADGGSLEALEQMFKVLLKCAGAVKRISDEEAARAVPLAPRVGTRGQIVGPLCGAAT
jgi:hypothetical protein